MTQATNPNPRPGKPPRTKHQFVVDWRVLLVALVLIVLAVGTVITTAQANHQQTQAFSCGAQVVTQTIAALKARDDVQRNVTTASNEVVLARERVIHVMADAVTGRNTSPAIVDTAVAVYDQAVVNYEAANTAANKALDTAPLPNPDCLIQRRLAR